MAPCNLCRAILSVYVHICVYVGVYAYMNKLPVLFGELYIAIREEAILGRSLSDFRHAKLLIAQILIRIPLQGCSGSRVIPLRTLDVADG